MDAHKVGEKGGAPGEVMRRINVVYFLSRGGRTDHPHLFRVNHLNRAGVRLRDVKRWLSELRGKDMPDNYSWSYKRKYKAGYVWQDLKDDDLITPISDNEYVLKGCDVRGTPPPPFVVLAPTKTPLQGEKKEQKETPCNNDHQDRPVEVVLTQDSDENSPKTPPPADQDSPAGCDSARRSFKVDEEPRGVREQTQHQQQEVVIKIEVARSQEQEHPHEQKQQQQQKEEEATEKAVAREERRRQGAVRSHTVGQQQARRMRVARALHSMLTCGAADADDAALRPVARRQGRGAAEAAGGDDWAGPTPTCPGMDGCGLRVSRTARSRRGGKEKQGKRDAHKPPATLPRCSECGKEFKPQELHAHMQSCRGFRERMRSTRASVDRRRNSTAGHRGKHGHCSSEERPSSASAVFLLTES
ncbi:hypothetical protein HU200_007646 [Digitaria exilis]|uniref:SOSEKI DIX-like domain-containing protein n=1 Tax=Digitaria exilis TaxID=1010633 RepID=A0A835FMW1_9POAL|nr:hypothetical protein HU200_007646 [Digitaria exilis]CAB3474448.1 unnamed protein product [Digitaria exilis]CAB3478493.1 unnamed protein product [Digitaria exilis]